MGVRVIDISNHQAGMDVESVVRQNGVVAVFILTNDGTFVNSHFHAQADAAERGGAMVVPYVYLRPNWAQTIDIHLNVVGSRYKQSLVDVEDGSGGWNECWNAHNRLWAAGRDTPLLYWPRYHWQTMGSPNLAPLASRVKGHWKSWYPDTVARGFDAGFAQVPGYVWDDNRGGIPVRLVQFTGTGRLSGYGGNLDLNYFPGTRAELAALLGGEEDDVSAEDVLNYPLNVEWPGGEIHPANVREVLEGSELQHSITRGEINALKVKIDALADALGDDEAKILAALRTMPTGGQVDIPAFVAALVPALTPMLPQGITEKQLRGALVDTLNNVRLSTGG